MKENGFTLKMERSRRYPAETNTDADYTDDLALLANRSTQVNPLVYSLEQVARIYVLNKMIPSLYQMVSF